MKKKLFFLLMFLIAFSMGAFAHKSWRDQLRPYLFQLERQREQAKFNNWDGPILFPDTAFESEVEGMGARERRSVSYELVLMQENSMFDQPVKPGRPDMRLTIISSNYAPLTFHVNTVSMRPKVTLKVGRIRKTKDDNPFWLNETKDISEKEYQQIISAYQAANICAEGFEGSYGFDGSTWIIEQNGKSGYCVINPWSPSHTVYSDLLMELYTLVKPKDQPSWFDCMVHIELQVDYVEHCSDEMLGQ